LQISSRVRQGAADVTDVRFLATLRQLWQLCRHFWTSRGSIW